MDTWQECATDESTGTNTQPAAAMLPLLIGHSTHDIAVLKAHGTATAADDHVLPRDVHTTPRHVL